MTKDFLTHVSETAPQTSDMELVNKYTVTPVSADDVFIFNVVLCDNEIDRDNERFDTPALKKIAELYVGKTGIFDHSMRGKDQVARIFKAEVSSNGEKNSFGEDYLFVKASAYMAKTPENAALIEDIRAGIKKEVSVNCSLEGVFCSVCGKNMRTDRCSHRKGTKYDGRLCFGIMKNPSDAYEWSFVAVPAQPKAGVTKSFGKAGETQSMEAIMKSLRESDGEITLAQKDIYVLLDAFDALESQAADGRAYREELEKETARLGIIAINPESATSFGEMLKKLSTEQLCELKKTFGREAAKKLPLNIQLKSGSETAPKNDEFII